MNKLLTLVDRIRDARGSDTGDRAVGVGTVRTVERQVFIEVVAVSGETFIGKLARCGDDLDVSMLRLGLVVLVAAGWVASL